MKSFFTDIYENIKYEMLEISDLLKKHKVSFLISIIFLFSLFFYYMSSSPLPKLKEVYIDIEEGTSVKAAAEILKTEGVIRSRTLFSLVVQFSDEKIIKAGEYLFSESESLFEVSDRLMNATYGIPFKIITLGEGKTVEQMGVQLESNLKNFNYNNFIKIATKYEGFLFPDTYKFSSLIDEIEVIEILRDNFNTKMIDLKVEIQASGKTLDEIITMASVVEKEASRDSIQEVTNILWHRMEIDMLLQVDATFVYSIGKHSFTVTKDEMQDAENLYNTYRHKGLPPTPISNPGLESIRASLYPESTENLFFLTGQDGNMYYATNFEGHKSNRILYLN